MTEEFDRIDWSKGVWLRQRVSLESCRIPQNFRKHPFTTIIVTVIHPDDFPLEQFRDLAEIQEWIDHNFGQSLKDGIYYLHAYGWHTLYYLGRKKKAFRIFKFKRGAPGLLRKRHYGIIPLAKFEMLNGMVLRLMSKRGFSKHPPRNERRTYPVWRLLKAYQMNG